MENAHVNDDPLAKVMIVRYGLELRDACVLGVWVRPILVLAAEFRQRSEKRRKTAASLNCPGGSGRRARARRYTRDT